MDGAIASYGAETPRHLAAQWQLTGESAAVQGGLFEQLLNLTLAVPSARNENSPDSNHSNDDSSLPVADESVDGPRVEERDSQNAGDEQSEDASDEATVIALTTNLDLAQVQQASAEQEPEQAAVEQLPLETNQHAQELPDDSTEEATLELPTVENATSEEPEHDPNRSLEQNLDAANEQQSANQEKDQTTATQRRQRNDSTTGESTVEVAEAAPEVVDQPVADQSEPEDDEQVQAAPLQADESAPDDSDTRERRPREKWYQKDVDASATGSAELTDQAVKSASSAQGHSHSSLDSASLAGLPTDAEAPQQPATANSIADEALLGAAASELNAAATVPTTANVTTAIVSSSLSAASAGDLSEGAQNANANGGTSASETKATAKQSKVAGEAEPAPDLTQQERVRLVQRISRSFARLGPMGGQVNIKLHPPQLGSLNVQVRLEGRSMTAKLSTENAAARDAILESLPILRGRLAEQGFEISQFQVEVASNDTNAAGGGSQSQFGQSENHGESLQRRHVDYRRQNASLRAPASELAASTSAGSQLTWQTMAGIDLQA